ncbi:MAG: aminopeptidase P family protein [Acholeplasmatales bacterium]|nr:aminopeptidase P family protein [Acholeplasmatales bacterium]
MDLLQSFQALMTSYDYDAYIIPTSDYHNSEYVSDYFKCRAYLSGFTGSAGTLIVTKTNAYLWVDGRYFIQAEKQIKDKKIELMKIGEPDVPTIEEFLGDFFKDVKRKTLGFDGKVLTVELVNKIKSHLKDDIIIKSDVDLMKEFWIERPKMPFSVLYKLNKSFTGKTYNDKVLAIREEMKKYNADIYLLTQLEDQAWLYNLRANDVIHTPVFLAYTIITKNQSILFIDDNKIDLTVEKYLNDNDIIVKDYDEIYNYLSLTSDKRILVDLTKINYSLYSEIELRNEIIDRPNPTLLLKAIKNDTEIKNIKNAHIKDGVAMVKFMHYVKKSYASGVKMDEISLSDKLQKLREANKGLIDLSFNTICGFKDHAAMMHYSATPESKYQIEGNGFLLVDSGGHYLEGTTDITRTFALGKITDEMKTNFTAVLKAVINLADATFLDGCTGQNLDILARGQIWKRLIDYKCGTGHGVGYVLSVHEGPNSFRWQTPNAILKPGMITTDEPGIYLEGKYGIRTENELLCVLDSTNEWGTFYKFETITYCPIDIDAIKPSMLTKYEKDWLNEYHQMVFEKLSPSLKGEDLEFLKEYTKKI